MPRATLVAFGRALGALAWTFARSARRLAIANAARLGVHDAATRGAGGVSRSVAARELARRSFVELGALLGDTIALLDSKSAASDGLAFAEGARETLRRAHGQGRGVVLVTAHLGPWERLAACLVEAEFPLTTPVRPSYDPRLERLLHRPLRAGRGVRAIDRDAPSTPRVLLRALREGGVIGFLGDLHTRAASVQVPFFDAPAWTVVAPARFALRTGAPVVAAFATRAGIVVELVREASLPAQGAIDPRAVIALTATLSRHLCRAIAAEPERWIWMHDRWRGAHPLPAYARHSVDAAAAAETKSAAASD